MIFNETEINKKLDSLAKSKFRSNFKLTNKDIIYVKEKGLTVINEHANSFIKERLARKIIPNDGKQTPFRGHPVFIAQHATATCCRSCLEKWHNISKNKELNSKEILYIQTIILKWIQNQLLTSEIKTIIK